MDVMEILRASADSGALGEAARARGLGGTDLQALLKSLVPALATGLQQNARTARGAKCLRQALADGDHRRYLEDVAALTDEAGVADGNAILGHILGSKNASRNVATGVAIDTGLEAGVVKRLLPIVAAATMAALSRQIDDGTGLEDGFAGGREGLGKLFGEMVGAEAGAHVFGKFLSLRRSLF